MSIALIAAALVSELEEITSIGVVDLQEGRQESLPWGDGVNVNLPLWTVQLVGSEDWQREGRTLGQLCLEHTWTIKGYYPFNFEAGSYAKWLTYLDSVIDKLKPSPALTTVCTLTKPARVVENDYVMYRSGAGGEVLCHYARLEFVTHEWVTY